MTITAARSTPTANAAVDAAAMRTRRQLEGPIGSTMLSMALPNFGEAAARIAFLTFDAYFVGKLGVDSLAGLGLVLPLFLIAQTTTAGGMGIGVSSAVARALGGGRRDDANALVLHAIVVALGMGALFGAAALLGGPALYRLMGGANGTLAAALQYSTVVFLGAPMVCLANLLANVVRGTGHMKLSAGAIVAGEFLHLALSPTLIHGLGPIPALGMRGAALAALSPYTFATTVFVIYLLRGRGGVRLVAARPRRELFAAILGVGSAASVMSLQFQLVGVVLTGLVGRFGPATLAGYTAALRLELAQVPLVFGFGAALIAMVGTNIGANQAQRARRAAWVGGAIGTAISGAIGLAGLVFAQTWIGFFVGDAAAIGDGALYLWIVAPTFPLFGLAMALTFAAQGAGRPLATALASLSRLVVVGLGGWLVVVAAGGGYRALLFVVAASFIVQGASIAWALARERWH